MASITLKFRPSRRTPAEGHLYFRIIHRRCVRQLTTDYTLRADEWCERRSMPLCVPGTARFAAVSRVARDVAADGERLARIVANLERSGLPYTADDILARYRAYCTRYSLFGYMEWLIADLRSRGHVRTSETYRSALQSIRRFRQGRDIMLDALTPELVQAYEAHLQARGNVPNTTSFYMRILRAVYNRALDEDEALFADRRPFRRVYTGVDRTVKRALPLELVGRIRQLDLSSMPAVSYARDMFMMSFYLRGMSFVDMSFLRKSDLRGGYITYRRRKTGRTLRIKWTSEMQQILDRYAPNTMPYLLPLITSRTRDERRAYLNKAAAINHHLKLIGRMVGSDIPLTLYCARHSWATAARGKGVPLSVISQGMGHASETTTRIYLASLAASVVDDANSLIIASLR